MGTALRVLLLALLRMMVQAEEDLVHVISPIDGAEVSRKFVEVRVEVTSYGARKDAWGWAREDDGSSGKHVCMGLPRSRARGV